MLFCETKAMSTTIKQWAIDSISILLLIGIFYAIWLGSYALFVPDEGRYSAVGSEMLQRGDYVTPYLNGVIFMDKPILYYWLQASAIKMFGLNEWALRFWPASIGVLGCLITYIAGHIIFNRRTGILSAIILAVSPLYYGATHYANLDSEVGIFIASSLLFFIAGMSITTSRVKRDFCLVAAYIFMGLATLTKGLIGIVLPIIIIGLWVLLLHRWNSVKQMRLITGIIIWFIIAVPWYVLMQKTNPEFFHFFFVTQQISRFLSTDSFNSRVPFWFYFPILFMGFFPWSLFILQAGHQKIKNILNRVNQYEVELFLLIWVVCIFIFFSIPSSKTMGYIVPLFPALSLLVGSYFDQMWSMSPSKGFRLGSLGYVIFCSIIPIFLLMAPHIKSLDIQRESIVYLNIAALMFFVSGIMAFFLQKKRNIPPFFLGLVATGVVLLLTLAASAPAINVKTVKPLALQLKPYLRPEDEVVNYYRYYYDLSIYLNRKITLVADWNSPDIQTNDNWVRELWYAMPYQDTKDWLISEDAFWQRWHSTKRIFVFLNKGYLGDFTKRSKSQIYMIGQYKEVDLVSNTPIT